MKLPSHTFSTFKNLYTDGYSVALQLKKKSFQTKLNVFQILSILVYITWSFGHTNVCANITPALEEQWKTGMVHGVFSLSVILSTNSFTSINNFPFIILIVRLHSHIVCTKTFKVKQKADCIETLKLM